MEAKTRMKYYTGVGSRKTPKHVLVIITKVATKLCQEGWILRSGGADGADKAFELGSSKEMRHIYYANDATDEAIKLASLYHPAWYKCSDYAKKLHGRNSLQVLGRDLMTPSKFVICWTPDGCIHHNSRKFETGGTGTAISIASLHGIEIFNLQNKEHFDRISSWLESRDNENNRRGRE
jgi:hypothetical protein